MKDAILERGLPISPDAERFVLGGILVDSEQFSLMAEILDRNDFGLHAHRLIWDGMVALHERGSAIDRMTLAEHMHQAKTLESAGGVSVIVDLDDGMPRLSNLEAYAEIVKERAVRRQAIEACNATIDKLTAGDIAKEVLESARQSLTKLAETVERSTDVPSVGEIIRAVGIEQLLKPRSAAAGAVSLPWDSLRQAIPALMPGQLILWAARPSCGKTVAGAEIARFASASGHPSVIVSLEMKREALLLRMACALAGVDRYWIETGRIKREAHRPERDALQRALAELNEIPLYIMDNFEMTVTAIKAALRKLKVQRGLGLVVVDYLQLLGAAGRFQNANERVSHISRSLKLMAGELNVPVVALSQLSRDPAKADRSPELSDLRDSGSLEQDADVVVFNHIPKFDFAVPVQDLEIVVRKQRDGAVRKCKMRFERQFTRIIDTGEEGRP